MILVDSHTGLVVWLFQLVCFNVGHWLRTRKNRQISTIASRTAKHSETRSRVQCKKRDKNRIWSTTISSTKFEGNSECLTSSVVLHFLCSRSQRYSLQTKQPLLYSFIFAKNLRGFFWSFSFSFRAFPVHQPFASRTVAPVHVTLSFNALFTPFEQTFGKFKFINCTWMNRNWKPPISVSWGYSTYCDLGPFSSNCASHDSHRLTFTESSLTKTVSWKCIFKMSSFYFSTLKPYFLGGVAMGFEAKSGRYQLQVKARPPWAEVRST